MAEIGSLLRETRMRERIDITTVESATKIRAKYLRALENEEWDQLPGPTFVRTFLRTYADYLGLDSKMLVEDYKQRFKPLLNAVLRAAGHRDTAILSVSSVLWRLRFDQERRAMQFAQVLDLPPQICELAVSTVTLGVR